MLDDDLLKQLHHVLLEVCQYTLYTFSLTASFVYPRRRRFDDLSKLRAALILPPFPPSSTQLQQRALPSISGEHSVVANLVRNSFANHAFSTYH